MGVRDRIEYYCDICQSLDDVERVWITLRERKARVDLCAVHRAQIEHLVERFAAPPAGLAGIPVVTVDEIEERRVKFLADQEALEETRVVQAGAQR